MRHLGYPHFYAMWFHQVFQLTNAFPVGAVGMTNGKGVLVNPGYITTFERAGMRDLA
jgi:hypothetical protein